MPYQVRGTSDGAADLTMACSFSAMTRSASGISAIFASTSPSPSPLPLRAARRSLAVSLIAACSSALNTFEDFLSATRPTSLESSAPCPTHALGA